VHPKNLYKHKTTSIAKQWNLIICLGHRMNRLELSRFVIMDHTIHFVTCLLAISWTKTLSFSPSMDKKSVIFTLPSRWAHVNLQLTNITQA
jgi:hypothetical protein